MTRSAEKPSENLIAVDGVHNRRANISSPTFFSDAFYANLRESDIKEAFLLCYHYRYTSKQNCRDILATCHFVDYKSFKLSDLIASDFPEIIDETLCTKSKRRPKFFADK